MTITREKMKKIESAAKGFFEGASGCHDWKHVERVRSLALRIAKEEKADREVVEAAVLLHDIGRKEEMESRGAICHAEKGAIMARDILEKLGIDQVSIEAIMYGVRSHRYRKGNIPETLEAKVLFDADKLDSIGAIGIARDFLFAGNAGSGNLYTGNERRLAKTGKDYSYTQEDSAILEYEVKLKFVAGKMLTKTGKKIARDRHLYMRRFFDRFWKEVEGKS